MVYKATLRHDVTGDFYFVRVMQSMEGFSLTCYERAILMPNVEYILNHYLQSISLLRLMVQHSSTLRQNTPIVDALLAKIQL